jgi:hypothetical protein
VSEWLDLMMDEVSRKRSEELEALEEQQRRVEQEKQKDSPADDQS